MHQQWVNKQSIVYISNMWMDLLKQELHCEVYSIQLNVKKKCRLLAAGRWFSPDTLASCTNKTDHDDTAEILLKVA